MADMILGKVVGGVAAGIGLVSEGIKAKRKQSAAKKLVAQNSSVEESSNVGESSSDHSRSIDSGRRTDEKPRSKSVEGEIPSHPPPSYEEALEYDEEQWDLDDAQHDLKLPIPGEQISARSPDEPESSAGAAKEKPIQNVHKLTDAFMAKHPVPEYIGEAGKMGLPIVLPQRRPKDRHRGFIRAYAPILEVKGIDQETFLEFIETFDKASQASPWIQAINLANFATIPLAPPFSFLVSIGIKMAVDSATEMHSRRRTNTFLDRANTEFFRPRGLFCLVMTWNPESDQRTDTIDITSTISNRIHLQSSSTRTQRIQNQFSYSNGNTYGDIEFPEVAPLVFPALDQLADQKGEEAATKMEKLKKAKNFASEYFDRRAVAKYAGENPDSVLAAQAGAKPTFTSRYADPNHPASNGNLISLVTGGHINPQPYMTDMQNSRMVAMEERRALMWGGRRDMFGRDMYGRGRYAGDMYGGDMYGRDMYGRPGFGGGFGRRGRGLENTGMGMLIGALVDRGSRSQSSNQSQPPQQSLPPRQYQDYHPDEKHYPQEESQFMQQPRQLGMMGPGVTNPGSAGIMPSQQRGAPYGPGYGRGRPDPMDNPLALLNPIVGVKRILKQKVLYLMIVDMPTDEQLAAAAQELGRA